VVTDLGMPEMSGWEVVEAIRRRSSTVPIVLITGLMDPGVMRRAGEQALPVVPKPFRSEVLRAAVAEALQANSSSQGSLSAQG
jgi:CheY-like chemotaxis protein